MPRPTKNDSSPSDTYESVYTSIQNDFSEELFGTPLVGSGNVSSDTTDSYSSVITRRGDPGLPLHRAVVVVTNAALGAGMLNFPEAYGKTGGVAQALVVQTCFVVLIIGSFLILGYCKQVNGTTTYQDIIRHFCGITAQTICEIIVVLYMFGCNVTHMILIGDQLTKVIHHGGWYFDRKVVITVVSCIFILPLCIPERLKVVSYSSLLSGLGALYVCSVVVSRYYTGDYGHHNIKSPSSITETQLFAAVPVICFGFQCHVTAVAVFAELRRPTLIRFGMVSVCATVICTIIYSLTGAYGYLTFGNKVESDILVNYKKGDIPAIAARALIVIVVFSTFAICQFVGRSAIIGFWVRIRKMTVAEVENSGNKRRITTSVIWFFSSLAIALFVPTIGKAIAIVGALAAHFIFTFPGLCLTQLMLADQSELTPKRILGLFTGIMYIVIGIFLFGDTVTHALMEDIEGKSLN